MENNQPDQQQVIPVQPLTQVPPTPPVKPKKSYKRIGFIILGVTIVLLIIFSMLFFLKYNNKKSVNVVAPTPKPSSPIVKPTAQVTPSNTLIELTLIKGKVIPIPSSDVSIEYIGGSIPNPKCFDCIATTDILLIRKDIQKKLSYSCGGIAGQCISKNTELNLEVTLVNATEAAAQVTIKKQ